ncbi:WXG100 family type VII secretion target [Streptomyces sp. ISL-12]|uniref:WXG100 family type VII secretion target n=1 Tax=Streptomyces sp. ISL-12 TaxID=2819177 RepID=UPI001BEA9841|nr:WXG100 family type VII secretion target [Streptomyces sp. ISL-12]MBT2413573.1 WXG100 family type VII secretion target [Streptomyces sp. ISL-12]
MSNFSDGYIHVDYNHADNAGQDMIQQSRAIATIVSNLEMELGELKESWVGDDKDVYAQVQAEWDQAVTNISKLLENNSLLLGDISQDYQRRERSRAQSWSTVKIGG